MEFKNCDFNVDMVKQYKFVRFGIATILHNLVRRLQLLAQSDDSFSQDEKTEKQTLRKQQKQ